MDIKYTATKGPNGSQLWFCTDSMATDPYSRNASSGHSVFPASCHFVNNYFLTLGESSADSVFIDVGANIGLYSLSVASCGVRTIAVEALAKNYALLSAAIVKNRLPASVLPIHAAASDSFDLLRLAGHSAWGKVSPQGTEAVAGVPLGEMLPILGAPKPTLIKIDVEGFEGPVLKGLRPIIEPDGDVDLVVEIFPNNMTNMSMLEDFGYTPFAIYKNKLIRTSASKFNPLHVADYFCTRKTLGSTFASSDVCEYDAPLIVELVRSESRVPVPIHRTSIGERLRTAPPEIRENAEVADILSNLRNDADPNVAKAATW